MKLNWPQKNPQKQGRILEGGGNIYPWFFLNSSKSAGDRSAFWRSDIKIFSPRKFRRGPRVKNISSKIFYIEQPRVGIPVEAGTPASKHRWRSSLDRSTVAAHRQDTQKSIALHLKKSPTAIQIWDFAADVTDLGCEGVGEWGFVQHGSTLIWLPVPTILQSNVNFSGSEFFTQNPLLVSNI